MNDFWTVDILDIDGTVVETHRFAPTEDRMNRSTAALWRIRVIATLTDKTGEGSARDEVVCNAYVPVGFGDSLSDVNGSLARTR